MILHPYAVDSEDIDASREIVGNITGETLDGEIPHGFCKVQFKYNGQLHKEPYV